MGIFDFFSKSKKETLDPVQKETLDQGLEKTKQTFFSKITRLLVGKSRVDQGVLDDLEELLITADVGVETILNAAGVDETPWRIVTLNTDDDLALGGFHQDGVFRILDLGHGGSPWLGLFAR